jgi:hypothetical protein
MKSARPPKMEKTTNWDDPVTCTELIERVRADEYTRLFKAHRRATVAATVNGYTVRPVNTAFGRLFAVDGTGNAYASLDDACEYAASLPSRLDALIREYEDWQKANGLTLGPADEHLYDCTLTKAQRLWLRNFSRRWKEASKGHNDKDPPSPRTLRRGLRPAPIGPGHRPVGPPCRGELLGQVLVPLLGLAAWRTARNNVVACDGHEKHPVAD